MTITFAIPSDLSDSIEYCCHDICRPARERERRTSVTAVYKGQAPSVFVSVLVPYRGTKAPDCRILTDTSSLIAGQNSVEIALEIENKEYILLRKI
ncbi:MAG: hypothetical protein ABI325_12315 [Ginsengibacter sp.]